VTVNVAVANPGVLRSGSVANWSASILCSSSEKIYDVKIKTCHRTGSGAWAQASNKQALTSLVPGTPVNVNGIFTPGNSNRFKIEIEYHRSDGAGLNNTDA